MGFSRLPQLLLVLNEYRAIGFLPVDEGNLFGSLDCSGLLRLGYSSQSPPNNFENIQSISGFDVTDLLGHAQVLITWPC